MCSKPVSRLPIVDPCRRAGAADRLFGIGVGKTVQRFRSRSGSVKLQSDGSASACRAAAGERTREGEQDLIGEIDEAAYYRDRTGNSSTDDAARQSATAARAPLTALIHAEYRDVQNHREDAVVDIVIFRFTRVGV